MEENEGGEFMEDFGQKVDLTQRIREVLLNYPEGTTILKELMQNADDAGASKICFCVDRRHHSVQSLMSPSLAQWQGPSLLCYNNAQFTEEDFESISRIGDSKKATQSWKTGRFGVGFNSVYHLSDLPSFVSGKYVVFFDPHCKFLPRVSSTNPGKRIDFVASQALNSYRNQFQPYCAFGCNMEGPFNGTLFRFPLRSLSQASSSRLSKQSYTSEDMSKLLFELYSEADLTMLFLKNIEAVEFYEWNSGESSPLLLYSCSLSQPTAEVRHHRQAFLRMTGLKQTKNQADVYRLDLVFRNHLETDGEGTLVSYVIAQRMAPPTSRASLLAKTALEGYGLHLVPWSSVAAKISTPSKDPGRAFCFLPLPLTTGLPVHVNGYFELSSNRRDIWYGSDMEGMGKLRSDWNQCLLEEVAAPALCHLVYESRKLGAGSSYYSLWPQEIPAEPWSRLVKNFYKAVATIPLLYSPAGNGKWLTAAEAAFHDEEYVDSDGLADALIAQEFPLVRPTKPVRSILLDLFGVAEKVVTPAGTRTFLRKKASLCKLDNRNHVCAFLDYCLSDVVDEEAGQVLRGLPLLPLENNRLGVFNLRTDGDAYFLCTNEAEKELLNGVPEKMLDPNLPPSLGERLARIAGLGGTSIWLLDDAGLVLLLQFLLPADWKNSHKVNWIPGIGRHPTERWLTLFWDNLRARRTELKKLVEWPLLPTRSGMLHKLGPVANLLRSGKMSSAIEDTLMQLGCEFMEPKIPLDHPQLSQYVLEPTAASLLDVLASVAAAGRFENVSDTQKRDLRNYLYDVCWFGKNDMNEARIHTFKSLPFFEVHDFGRLIFSPLLGSRKFLEPVGLDVTLLGSEFVHSYSSKETEVLRSLLGVARMDKAAFFKQRVLGRITEISGEQRDKLVLQILRELPEISIADRSIVQILKQVAFVPAGDEKLSMPEGLYDPENVELVNLLEDRDFFPSVKYSTPEILQVLRSLGLRSDILPDTLIACARRVESLLVSEPEKASERGRALLAYLEANSNKWLPSMQETAVGWVLSKATMLLQGERDKMLSSFWNELSTICWCPVLLQPVHPQMPWPSVSQPVAPPKLVRLQTDMWLASATMRILDGHCNSPGLCERLGWNSRLGGNVLAAQLLELAKCSRNAVHQLGKVLATTIPKVYSHLSDMLQTEEMEVVKAILQGSRWVWVGTDFVEAERVVFDGPSYLAPYLYIVPPDLAAFKELFVELGVRESLTLLGYNEILSRIAVEKQREPLDSRQLTAVIWIVQHLADAAFGRENREVYVPNTDAVLVVNSQLVYNDAPWLLASRSTLGEDYNFVHSKISNDVADKVGVSSVRRSLLAQSADFMELELHNGMEAFGQSESLTSRLKHIVEMYADGPGILFELLQNADDAGAEEVCFLLDKSHHGTDSVLCRQMAEWQGPALYSYNSSIFKPEDLYAISRIGQNSKLEKPSAIGRFGLGFNSVYHFTDVPGFVSGSNIVMLDPHAANLPGITPAQPGLKINFVGRGLLKQFPDQFEPFLRFGCDLQRPFNGTLFRFPLRNDLTARRSEIKPEAYRPEDVEALLMAFENSAAEVLLFLRNVKKIKVYVQEDQGAMEQSYEVLKQGHGYIEDNLVGFVRGTGQKPDKEEFVKRLQNTLDKQLPWSCGKIELSVTSRDVKNCSSWLISSALGGGNAKVFAVEPANQSRGFVPWAGVAAKLPEPEKYANHLVSKFEDGLEVTSSLAVEGRAFCFLPLPVKVGLPVHVNGYFELSANRRDIWYGGDMVGAGRLKSEWNRYLVEDAGAVAYARLLEHASRELGPGPHLNSLWPVGDRTEPWTFLVKRLYNAVARLELPVLYTAVGQGKWITTKQAVFPDFSFPEMNELGNALVAVGLPLVSVPEAMVVKFREVEQPIKFLSPRLLRRLLIASKRTFNRHLSILALKYCLSDVKGSAEAQQQLHGLSLLPLASGSFGTLTLLPATERFILVKDEGYELLKDAVSDMLIDSGAGEDVLAALQELASSGTLNIVTLKSQLLAELLPKVLPRSWSGEKMVSWTPGAQGHPSEQWIDILWKFLSLHSEDLAVFSDWPLLPTSDGKLLQLLENGPVLMNDSWSENVASLLQACGCYLLPKEFAAKHPLTERYVHESTAGGVLLAMFSAAGGNLRTLPSLLDKCSLFEIRDLRRFLFQSRWFIADMDVVQLEVLRLLRLFESNGKLISVAESKQLIAPEGIDNELLGQRYIRAESQKEEQILTTYLGLKKLDKKDYFEEHFVECLEQVPQEKRGQAFLKVVGDIRRFVHLSSIMSLSQLPFVPTTGGSVEAPERLYDPRVSELQELLDKDAFFPAKEFLNDGILDLLSYFGLRKTMGRAGLLDAAKSVAMISNTEDEQEARRRGEALLLHIDSLVAGSDVHLELDEQFWIELSTISWCPVCTLPPSPVLPWFQADKSSLAPPKLIRPSSDAWLVSGTMRILEGNCSEELCEKLGWKAIPNAVVLANQLVQVSNQFSRLQESNELVVNETLCMTISKEIRPIYSMMQSYISTQAILVIQSMLEGQPWLWIGDRFVGAETVALDVPGHFHPYLHSLPLELEEFRDLFENLGVKRMFNFDNYVKVLSRVGADANGEPLDSEQLSFVLRLLEAIVEGLSEGSLVSEVLLPDATSYLVPAQGLVYNDAPWLANSVPGYTGMLRLVHPDVSNDIARKLGARSLRYLSVVDQEMTSSLPCMGVQRISELLSNYGGASLLLFDFMEIADCCQAKKVHFIYDTRDHPKQSLLQPNLGDFQGPALLVVFEEMSLTTEQICALHSAPPVKLHGYACRYGCGLLAAYWLTDLLSIVSGGCLYLFDPSGQIISQNLAGARHEVTQNPLGKAFSLLDTGLAERFRDQFIAFEINSKLSWDSTGVTIFRLPLRTETQGTFKLGKIDVSDLFDQFKNYAPASLLFLKSLEAITLSEWIDDEPLRERFSVSTSSFTNLRHHFQENKWRRFQLSNFFGGSNATIKTNTMHVLIKDGAVKKVSTWLVSQALGSGCSRDMALDRRYLHYNLTPVAGVAACISPDVDSPDSSWTNGLLSPLPVSFGISLPVTVFGHFLPIFEGGTRHVFDEVLGDFPVKSGLLGSHTGPPLSDRVIRATWNRQLLSCVLDSYLELIQELQRLYQGNSHAFWPKSRNLQLPATSDELSLVKWLIKPLYTRLLELPVWQLHTGGLVKFNEGVFIAPPGQGVPVKPAVSAFLRTHYRVFTVPWELGKEAEEVGASMKELSPKALRSLMKVPSIAAAVMSVDTQIDLLEYCCSDALLADGSEVNQEVLTELKGVTCPTASVVMVKLGTSDVWIATKEQQELLPHVGQRFLHFLCLERPLLASLVLNKSFQAQMSLKPFSPQILAANLLTVLPRSLESTSRPWVHWKDSPSETWLRKFWKNVDVSSAEELALFDRWMLVPATNGSSRLLVSVVKRNMVFVPPPAGEDDDTYEWLLPLLYKLNLPVFDSSFADCSIRSCCLSQQGLLPTVISKLVELKKAGALEVSPNGLTPADRDGLFGFFVRAASPLSEEAVSLLRSLPIYKNIRDDYVQIDADKSYIVPPEALFQPEDDEDRLPYLPPLEGGTFFQLLGVPQLRNSEILARYSLPRFSFLEAKEQENILRHLHDNWASWRTDAALVNALKATKFVRSALSSSTNLFQPEELLDPENEILKQVFADERQKFPGVQFTKPGWLVILRATGLRSIREPDLLLECSRKLEELGKRDLSPHQDLSLLKSDIAGSPNVSDAVWSMATMLVEEILNNFAHLYNSTFCGALSKIAFVPAEKGIPSMAGGSPNRVLVSYSNAAVGKDWPLAWTCCPLLTRPNMVPPEFSWGALQLRSPPPISVVMKHLQIVGKNAGEDVLSRWPNAASSRSVEDVFSEVLEYLGNTWDGLSDSDKRELSSHAFIPVGNGTRLVTASALYTRLGMDLAPFVFEVPRPFLSHVNVLTALGMQYEPTANSMKGLLKGLQQSCGYQQLNPNELHAVMSILRFVADDARPMSKIVQDAVVPDENSRLVSASYCAYVDAAAARFVSQIDSSRLRLVHPGLSEDLCTVLDVQKLSDIIVEELDPEMPLEPVASFGAYTESLIKERLGSSSFQQALWILLCEFQAQSKSTFKAARSKESMEETVRFLTDELRFVTRLYTKFLLLPARKDITRYPQQTDGGGQRRLQAFYFLNRAKRLVLIAQPPEFISVPDLLAVVLSRLLDLPISLPLGPLFNVRDDSDRVLRLVANGVGGRDSATSFSIGCSLLAAHSKLLQFCPLRPFYSGEIVAWQPEGDKYGLRYGRVTEDIRAPAGHPLYRIRVETSPGQVHVLSSSSVFSFKSTGGSSTSPASTASTSEASATTDESISSASSFRHASSQEETPLQGMQATEYAQAISDILTSLGLPLSLEKQSLLEHTLTLQDQLSSTNTLLLSEQVRADSTAKELEATKSSWTCRVCFTSEVDFLLAPCGHVICHGCCMTLSRCPFCRTFISSKHRMYRP